MPSILPLPLMEGPDEPEERVEALCASVRRLAELEPVCVVFLTGPGRGPTMIVREGIRAIAAPGEAAGVRVALEPVHPSQADVFSFVHTIPDALELIGDEDVAIMLDIWHVSDPDAIEPYVDGSSACTSPTGASRRAATSTACCPATACSTSPRFPHARGGRLRRLVRRRDLLRQRRVRRRVPRLALGRRAEELARRARESVERVWEQR